MIFDQLDQFARSRPNSLVWWLRPAGLRWLAHDWHCPERVGPSGSSISRHYQKIGDWFIRVSEGTFLLGKQTRSRAVGSDLSGQRSDSVLSFLSWRRS